MSTVLVAASGLASEVLSVLGADRLDDVLLLDDNPARWGTTVGDAPVVGAVERIVDYPGHSVVVCAGRGSARRSIVSRLRRHGVADERFVRVTHPAVAIPPGCEVGHGSILLAGVVLTANVTVGRHVVVMPNATLTHDDVLEDFATVCAGVSLGGGVHVGSGAYLGMNASVRERQMIGADATLGMGAVLIDDLPVGQTWAGIPARPLSTTPAARAVG